MTPTYRTYYDLCGWNWQVKYSHIFCQMRNSPAFLEKGLIPAEEGWDGNMPGETMAGGGGGQKPIVGGASWENGQKYLSPQIWKPDYNYSKSTVYMYLNLTVWAEPPGSELSCWTSFGLDLNQPLNHPVLALCTQHRTKWGSSQMSSVWFNRCEYGKGSTYLFRRLSCLLRGL